MFRRVVVRSYSCEREISSTMNDTRGTRDRFTSYRLGVSTRAPDLRPEITHISNLNVGTQNMSRVDIPCRIVRISVRRCFCPSIRPSVRQSVRPSMRRPSVHPLGPHSVVIRFASYRIVSHRIVSYRIVKCRASHIVSCCREGVSCDRRVCVKEVEPWVL